MTKSEAITELVRIWHSPHLDLMLKARLGEVIDALKENNRIDSLVRDEADDCKKSKSKLDLISRQDAIKNAHFPMIDDAGYEVVRVDDILALPSAELKTGKWIKVIDEETPNVVKWHYECDQCGAGRFEKDQQYCSRCGARMLGEDGEEE